MYLNYEKSPLQYKLNARYSYSEIFNVLPKKIIKSLNYSQTKPKKLTKIQSINLRNIAKIPSTEHEQSDSRMRPPLRALMK